MKILITGGRGYLGANLRNYIKSNGDEVEIFDKAEELPAENLLGFSPYIDAIVHLAAFPGVKNCKEDLERATIDNISSAFRIFYLAHRSNKPVIFTSSQAAKHPDHSLYGTIKRMIEIEADRYNKLGADIRVLRFTNIYGGIDYFQKKSTIIANIVKAIREDNTFAINGDGKQTRDFIHVDDICRAIWYCIEGKKFHNPIDVGTGKGTSILKITKIFKEKYPKFKFTNLSKSDMIGPMTSTADTRNAYSQFGFKSDIKLENWIRGLII